ncbi:hypothetical protein EBR96_09760, partial [bacterium]|nr:hypothetical protein [bacterium]
DRIIALTQRLSKRNFVPVLLGNVSADSPVARFRSPEAINLTNQTSMGDLVAWLAGCDVVIGADTGPMHIAAAAETPMVVVTRGKSNFPTRFGPWGSFVTILRREYECPQVATRLCTDSDCPALPSVDEIENAVLEIPSRRSARNPNALRELFFMHSIRVLVPCRNQVEWHRINALRRRFEKQRLIVVPYFWDGTIGTLCKELLRVNATVVMSSDLSLWQAKWTRRWMGIRYQYIPPIIIRRSVLVSDSVAELVSLYKECWRSGVGII